MELWDIFNKNGEPTGKTVKRGNLRLRSGEYHMVVHIWVSGPDGRWLIQRRSEHKKPMAGEWAATGGSVISGEASLAAAMRELAEELSIALPAEKFGFVDRIFRRHSFVDIWRVTFNGDISSLALQEDEVAEVMWVTEEQLRDMIGRGQFHDYGNRYFKAIFGINF